MTSAGATLGIEEEYHLVDAVTLELHEDTHLAEEALRERLGRHTHAEIATTQLEISTDVCATLEEARRSLTAARREAQAAAESVGAAILAASTHPTASWREQRLTSRPRYIELYEKWGILALQQVICGCHVHVAVPDTETAVRISDHARAYLPLLLAITGSSPFSEGTDTGWESFRTPWYARWAITGAPEPLGSEEDYTEVVRGLAVAGVIDDASNLYWDIRPSAKYPTLEYRIGDVCTSVDDAVLYAALLRALTATLARRVAAGTPPPAVRPELLRAARWRAARHGLQGSLFDAVRVELVDARTAVDDLLRELEPELVERGEWDQVVALVAQLFARGTSARRQREVLRRGGDFSAVLRMLVRETLAG